MTYASMVVRNTLPLNNATPLFDTPQQTMRGVSGSKFTAVRHSCLPLTASMATVHLASLTYITPS